MASKKKNLKLKRQKISVEDYKLFMTLEQILRTLNMAIQAAMDLMEQAKKRYEIT